MVWVEMHENEASRATEHKRFYEATTGKWTDAPKQRISPFAYMTSKSQGFSFG